MWLENHTVSLLSFCSEIFNLYFVIVDYRESEVGLVYLLDVCVWETEPKSSKINSSDRHILKVTRWRNVGLALCACVFEWVWKGQMDSSSCVCSHWSWLKFAGVWKTTLRPRLYLNRNISVWLTPTHIYCLLESTANSYETQNILKRFREREREWKRGKRGEIELLSPVFHLQVFLCLNCFDLCVLKREKEQQIDRQRQKENESEGMVRRETQTERKQVVVGKLVVVCVHPHWHNQILLTHVNTHTKVWLTFWPWTQCRPGCTIFPWLFNNNNTVRILKQFLFALKIVSREHNTLKD